MLNYFNFTKFRDKYLVTNDLGRYLFLTSEEFFAFTNEAVAPERELYQRLYDNYFIYEDQKQLFASVAGNALQEYKNYVFTPPSLHIFVVTKSCNQKCIYCQASTESGAQYNMDIETARRAVDIALTSPANDLTFEFQGGEPLMNYDTIHDIITYTNQNKGSKRVAYTLVSNLMYLTDEMIYFFGENGVNISTSLDGNEQVHNKNRPIPKQNALKILTEKIDMINRNGLTVSAIQTTTKFSLPYYKEIVDQYLELGIPSLFIRPLTALGYAKANWDKIGYSPEEFLEFYRNIMEYVIQCRKQGIDLTEGHASIFLKKILGRESVNYMELRSPCGGVFGQLAYYYNGDVYTCDEGRMLAEMGDQSFRLGNVYTNSYKEIVQNPICSLIGKSSCLESLPLCAECVYMPYCGVCPVINWSEHKNIYIQMKNNSRCKIYKGMQDFLFEKIYEDDENIMNILFSMMS